MKKRKYFGIALLALAGIWGFTGCGTTGSSVSKDWGVYTTAAMKGQNLDLPASGYTSSKTFGPGQTPAAVVVGYGYWDGAYNHPQEFNLEVVEAGSATVILNLNGSVFAGKAAVLNLPIRKSGSYKLKLVVNGSVYDTWDFTVTREAAATTAPVVYAKGEFSASINGIPEAFTGYDEYLLTALNEAVQKEGEHISRDEFAQMPPGQVVVQFDLGETGQAGSAKILQNTLNETLGQFFLRAVQGGSPYKAWPANVRAAFGAGSRSVTVTFFYE
ncbi:MAG: energy transducer TonB [Verrucomicrobiae bacterium]|nr:energy transducer TonB [Verrucomicrobiae bacterium]